MCGRYSQTATVETLAQRFRLQAPGPVPPRYNIAPTQQAPVVVLEEGRRLLLFRWGLIPHWAKDPAIGSRMINAKAETAAEKPSFRRPFQKSRCLVVCDGFYEWRREPGGKSKTPMRIALKSRAPFALAGLWDAWKTPDEKLLRSFTIITTAPNETVRLIHDRMPVVLRPEDEEAWLDPQSPPERLRALLAPYPGDDLEAYAVSPLVNSPANDKPGVVTPA